MTGGFPIKGISPSAHPDTLNRRFKIDRRFPHREDFTVRQYIRVGDLNPPTPTILR